MSVMIKDHLTIPARRVKFELSLLDSLISVSGNSGCGKSYLYEMLEAGSKTNKYPYIACYNWRQEPETLVENLNRQKGKIIIIDNADILLRDAKLEGGKLFIEDVENQYILFTRYGEKYGVRQENMTTLDEVASGLYSLEYIFR